MSQGGNISPIRGEAPTAPIETKICMVCHLADIMTRAKFQGDIFRGYDFTGGRISHFPMDFCMGLTTVHDRIFIPLDTIPERDGMKDRQTDRRNPSS